MKHLLIALSFFIISQTIATNQALAEDTIKLVSPLDMVWVDGKLINLICRIKSESFDSIMVTSNDSSDQVFYGTVAKFGIHHNSLVLSEGKNRISIQILQDNKVLVEKNLTVFLRSELTEKYANPPSGFKKYTFHIGQNEKNCKFCHAEELYEGTKSMQNETLPSCYTCHKKIIDNKYVHGPASVWACATCHIKNFEEIRNKVPDPEVIVCRICHAEELDAWQSEKFGHGPTMAGKCAFCHDPHASGENFFLNMNSSDLCGYCHRDKLINPHIVADFFKQGHPVKLIGSKNGKPDISCASCHNPHATNNVNLLKGFKESKTDLCRKCHFSQ